MTKQYPHFVIVGAPKAGTTSLHRYLVQHPAIFFPPGKKEPLFFCDYPPTFKGPGSDALNRSMVTRPEDYEALFETAADSMVTGDASTDYLACPVAAENIKAWNPDASIIIVLRNPVDRAYSEHMHLVRDCLEEHAFREALELEAERRRQGYVPLFRHRERGLYHDSVARYQSLFGSDRVKVLLHEDFTRSPQDTVNNLLRFLGLEPVSLDVSSRYNVSGEPRWPWLQSLYANFRQSDEQGTAKRLARLVSSGRVRQAVRKFYLGRNLKVAEGPTVEETTMLQDYFSEDVMRLGRLINRDLGHWVSCVEKPA